MRRRIVVAAALAGVLSLALWNVDFLVQRNRGFFIDRAERTLGRKISTDQIKVTFWPLGARLENFVLADDPAFSTEDFLRAKALHVELRLLPLFLGQFLAKRMALESPSITVVRDAQGRYNFANRARNEKSDRRGKTLRVDQQDGRLLWAPSFHIFDGTLRFRDLTDGGELTATQIHFKATDFASGDAFEIELEAALNAAKPNLQLKSWIGSNPENRDFRDVPVAGELNATDLDLGKVNKALPQLRRALPRALRFDGIYTIKQLKFKGTLNHLSLKGAVTGTDASFRFE